MPRSSLLDDAEGLRSRMREIAVEEGYGCQRCGTTSGVERRRQNTAYDYPAISEREGAAEGDEGDPNYVTLCGPCHEQNDEYWRGMWADYYGSRL